MSQDAEIQESVGRVCLATQLITEWCMMSAFVGEFFWDGSYMYIDV